MTFPTEPTVPLPTWATDSGALKVDPLAAKRAEGWAYAGLGLQYGEAPPFQWVNNELFNNGEWATYFKQGFDYINAGNLKERGLLLRNFSYIANIGQPVTASNVLYYNVPGTPSFYNITSGVFQAPVTGIYLYSISNIILTGSVVQNISGRVDCYVNTSFNSSVLVINETTLSTNGIPIIFKISLNSGDFVQLLFTFSSGTGLTYQVGAGGFISWNF